MLLGRLEKPSADCPNVTFTGAAEQVQWCDFTWRRGTVPIWWGVEMKTGGFGDVDVLIAADNPYRGSKRSNCGTMTV